MVLHHAEIFMVELQAYRVKRDAVAGTGKALAQDPIEFGNGDGTQFFLSNYKSVLEPVGAPFDIGP